MGYVLPYSGIIFPGSSCWEIDGVAARSKRRNKAFFIKIF